MSETTSTYYKPYFVTDINGEIIECNTEFITLTNYSKSDMIGASLEELCSLLKINSPSFLSNTDPDKFYYIFTKHNNPIEVKINITILPDKKIYSFLENPSSWLDNRFHFVEQIHTNDKFGIAIHNYSDFTLLASNQRYLSFFPSPYNKKSYSVGKRPEDIIPTFHGSNLEKILLNVAKTGKPFNSRQYTYIDVFSKKPIGLYPLIQYKIEINQNIF